MLRVLTLFVPETVGRRVPCCQCQSERWKGNLPCIGSAALCNKLTFTNCTLGANFGARVRALDATKGRDNAALLKALGLLSIL